MYSTSCPVLPLLPGLLVLLVLVPFFGGDVDGSVHLPWQGVPGADYTMHSRRDSTKFHTRCWSNGERDEKDVT